MLEQGKFEGRFGSKAVLGAFLSDVRFTPDEQTSAARLVMSEKCQRTNPLTREGLAAQSSDYVCRSNYLNERK